MISTAQEDLPLGHPFPPRDRPSRAARKITLSPLTMTMTLTTSRHRCQLQTRLPPPPLCDSPRSPLRRRQLLRLPDHHLNPLLTPTVMYGHPPRSRMPIPPQATLFRIGRPPNRQVIHPDHLPGTTEFVQTVLLAPARRAERAQYLMRRVSSRPRLHIHMRPHRDHQLDLRHRHHLQNDEDAPSVNSLISILYRTVPLSARGRVASESESLCPLLAPHTLICGPLTCVPLGRWLACRPTIPRASSSRVPWEQFKTAKPRQHRLPRRLPQDRPPCRRPLRLRPGYQSAQCVDNPAVAQSRRVPKPTVAAKRSKTVSANWTVSAT